MSNHTKGLPAGARVRYRKNGFEATGTLTRTVGDLGYAILPDHSGRRILVCREDVRGLPSEI